MPGGGFLSLWRGRRRPVEGRFNNHAVEASDGAGEDFGEYLFCLAIVQRIFDSQNFCNLR